ncbi:hypothetical protein KSF73_10970 [Burkholderiaceae bacterium DAT-1]|nr:hypothetical protein [Burkholderiaceae bacterium DAT-1]
MLISSWDKRGAFFGLIGKDAGVGHYNAIEPESAIVLLNQFPKNHLPVADNMTLSAFDSFREEGRLPDHSYLVNVPDRGAFARKALEERGKENWTPMGIFGTQCTVSVSKSLYAGGSSSVNWYPYRWPDSMTRQLESQAKTPGSGVTYANPDLVRSIYLERSQ